MLEGGKMSGSVNSYSQRIAVQSTIRDYINQLMIHNDLSPSMVEDALNKVIIDLHPLIIQEILEDEERVKNFKQARDELGQTLAQMPQEEVDDGTGVNTDNN